MMWADPSFQFPVRVVFPGEMREADSAICINRSDLRRLLHRGLEVLEAALLKLSELASKAAEAPQGQS